jgi:hypothetical protein
MLLTFARVAGLRIVPITACKRTAKTHYLVSIAIMGWNTFADRWWPHGRELMKKLENLRRGWGDSAYAIISQNRGVT